MEWAKCCSFISKRRGEGCGAPVHFSTARSASVFLLMILALYELTMWTGHPSQAVLSVRGLKLLSEVSCD
jgi:hypothetical protein